MSSDSTRKQILDAAGPVFAEKGFEKATVREICAAAGVNLAAVNYYFGDKHRLYVKTVQRAHENRAASFPMPAWDQREKPQQQLRGFIQTLMARMVGLEAAPWQTRLLMREVLSPTEACKALVEDYFRPQMEILLQILARMLPPTVEDHRRQKMAFSIVGQCVFYRVSSEVVSLLVSPDELQSHYSVAQLADHVADVCIASLENLPSHWPAGNVPSAPVLVHTKK